MAPPPTRRAPRDLWTRLVEGTVHVVEALCPALERTLSWDFKDGSLIALEVRFGSKCCYVFSTMMLTLTYCGNAGRD
jgi:hypothetical protein